MSISLQPSISLPFFNSSNKSGWEGNTYHYNTSVINILGYFPVIGIITGLFRLIVGSMALPFNEEWGSYQITRGVIEIAGMGVIFSIFDACGWFD